MPDGRTLIGVATRRAVSDSFRNRNSPGATFTTVAEGETSVTPDGRTMRSRWALPSVCCSLARLIGFETTPCGVPWGAVIPAPAAVTPGVAAVAAPVTRLDRGRASSVGRRRTVPAGGVASVVLSVVIAVVRDAAVG